MNKSFIGSTVKWRNEHYTVERTEGKSCYIKALLNGNVLYVPIDQLDPPTSGITFDDIAPF
jgi:hypothetical protein